MSDRQPTGSTKRPRWSPEDPIPQSGGKSLFDYLPREVLIHLTLFLNDEDLTRLALTCSSWSDILEDEYIWRMKCQQHSLKPCARILTTSETPWRDAFLERLRIQHNWESPQEVVQVRTDEETSRHRGQVIAVGCDRVLTLNAQKTLKAWDSSTGDFCWERHVDSDNVLLDGIILNTDFPNGRGTIISPETGEVMGTWDMGVITKVAIHGDRVVSVSDEGDPSDAGCLRFWSPDRRSNNASVRIANFNVDHLIFNGESVIVGFSLGDIEVWSASEFCLQHFYPNQAALTSLVSDEARIYVSFTDRDFVQVWSLGEQHETEVVVFERDSTLHLSEKLLIGLAPNNRVKVWDKKKMRCLHILDFGSPIIGALVQSTHLIMHKAGSILTICNVSQETVTSHDLDLGIPDGYEVRKIHANESALVVDVQKDDLFSSLLIFDFTRLRTVNPGVA